MAKMPVNYELFCIILGGGGDAVKLVNIETPITTLR